MIVLYSHDDINKPTVMRMKLQYHSEGMRQNTHSMLKRFKTERDYNSNQFPSRSTTPCSRNSKQAQNKLEHRQLASRRTFKHSNIGHNNQTYTHSYSSSSITNCNKAQKISLQSVGDGLQCINHRNKQGLFELQARIQQQKGVFCYECAINLVKQNFKIHKLNNAVIKLNQICLQQLEKLGRYESQIHQLVSQYCQNQRQKISDSFYQAKRTVYEFKSEEDLTKKQLHYLAVNIPNFNNTLNDKIIQLLGKTKIKYFQFYQHTRQKEYTQRTIADKQNIVCADSNRNLVTAPLNTAKVAQSYKSTLRISADENDSKYTRLMNKQNIQIFANQVQSSSRQVLGKWAKKRRMDSHNCL